MEFTKTYLLVNTNSVIQQQYQYDTLVEATKGFHDHIMYDINLLRNFGVRDTDKIYTNYVIYKCICSQSIFTPIVQYKFEKSKNSFVKTQLSVLEPAPIEVPQVAIDWADELITKHKNGLDDLEYNKTELADDLDIADIETKIKKIEELREHQLKDLKQAEHEHKQLQEEVADEICDINLAKTREKYEKEKLEDQKSRFVNDVKIYRTMKEEIATNKLVEKDISPLFMDTFNTLKTLDEMNIDLDTPEAFDEFIDQYKEIHHPDDDEYDAYGIFSK